VQFEPRQVEEWVHSLSLAPSSKAKLKSILSTLYNHAIRYEWLTFNPISRVGTSSKRLRDQGRTHPDEFQRLAEQVSVRSRAIVLIAGRTGLRRSEIIALTWSDLDTRTMEVTVLRSCVRNRFGNTKTESSRRPVPLHPMVLNYWRTESPYATDVDFLHPSIRLKGNKPLSPDSILENQYSACISTGRDCGQTNRMAQFPPFAGDELASTGHQGSSGIVATCEGRTTLFISSTLVQSPSRSGMRIRKLLR
jgi:integrase